MVVASRKRGEEGRSGQGGTFQHLTYLDSPQLLMRLKKKKKNADDVASASVANSN